MPSSLSIPTSTTACGGSADVMVRLSCLSRESTPKANSADTLLRLHLASAPTAIAELKERYEELCSRKSFLPYEFNLRLPDDLDLDQALSDLPPDFTQTSNTEGTGTGTDTDAAPNRVALALALMGWQGLSNTRIGAVPNSASCHTCLRRLGMWMFKSKEVGDDGAVLVPAPMDHLDAVREHRFFCPWKNADAQKLSSTARVSFDGDDGPRPGWRILQQTLRNDAHLRSVYAGQKRSSRPLFAPAATASKPPDTPTKGGTPQKQQQTEEPRTPANGAAAAAEAETLETPAATAEDDEKEQETKDKERWARLKRVKSLFDMKGSRRLSRASSSRPGTSRPGTSQSIRETPQE